VLEAATGAEALELPARGRVDAAVIDLGLPDIDGNEVARGLRAQRANARTPLVLPSVEPRPARRREACSS
jgi:DNA-binding response OmpR family regulator